MNEESESCSFVSDAEATVFATCDQDFVAEGAYLIEKDGVPSS